MNSLIVQDTKDGAILTVHIQPKASTTECVGIHGDALKIRVAAPPVDGAANDELIRFLARQLSIPSTSVRIHSGAGGRHKRVLIKGATAQLVMTRLNLGERKEPAKPRDTEVRLSSGDRSGGWSRRGERCRRRCHLRRSRRRFHDRGSERRGVGITHWIV